VELSRRDSIIGLDALMPVAKPPAPLSFFSFE
jgi:hypothetical protein